MPGRPECVILPGAGLWGGRVLLFDALPSTNQWSLEHAGELRRGDIVRAVRQTAGRGRFQRVWASPGNRCLTLSVVLAPANGGPPADAATRIAALAVCATLEEQGFCPLLKWPNDVLLAVRKVAGILAERSGGDGPVVLGIGLNVNMSRKDIAAARCDYPATSMAIERGRQCDVDTVCKTLLAKLEQTFDRTAAEGNTFLDREWRKRDALVGRNVEITTQTGTVAGEYLGLNPSGELRLRDAQGTERCFSAGDVSLNAW